MFVSDIGIPALGAASAACLSVWALFRLGIVCDGELKVRVGLSCKRFDSESSVGASLKTSVMAPWDFSPSAFCLFSRFSTRALLWVPCRSFCSNRKKP
jgi:hypothetical protein